MGLKDRINADVKKSLQARDMARVGVLRLVLAAIKQVEVDTRKPLDEAGTLAVFDKMTKQCRESITQYADAGREDLVAKESFEIEVIQSFLPKPLTEGEISALIEAAIAETGASSMKEMGKVMALLKPQIAGRGDFGAVSAQVKAMLG